MTSGQPSPAAPPDFRLTNSLRQPRYVAFFLASLLIRLLLFGIFNFHPSLLGPFSRGVVVSNLSDPVKWEMPLNLLKGRGFSTNRTIWIDYPDNQLRPTAHVAPVYPLFLAACYKILSTPGWENEGVQIVQAVLMSAAVVFFCIYFESLLGNPAAAGAFVFLNLNPFLAICHLQFYELSLAIFLSISAVLSTEKIPAIPAGRWPAFCAGILWGLLFLTQPAFMIFAAVLFLGMWGRRHLSLKHILLLGLGISLLLAPWVARNYFHFHKIVPVRSNFGSELWIGNNDQANGGFRREDGRLIEPGPALLEKLKTLDEVQQHALLQKEAVKFIRANPVRFLRLRLKAWLYFWTPHVYWLPPSGSGFGVRRQNFRKILFAWTLAVLAMAVLGVVLSIRNTARRAGLLAAAILAFSLVYGVTHGESYERYRLPLDPWIMGFASYATVFFIGKFSRPLKTG